MAKSSKSPLDSQRKQSVHGGTSIDATMDAKTSSAVAELNRLDMRALKVRYRELYGEASSSSNKQFLIRRIGWRLQAMAEGDLPERARRRALELANDADLRLRSPRSATADRAPARDWRLPVPGTLLTR